MKKLTILLSIVLLFGCSSKSKFEDPIKASIIKDAMGIDLKVKFNEIKPIDTVLVSESVANWYLLYRGEGESEMDAKNNARRNFEEYQELANKDPQEYGNKAKNWKWIYERINNLGKHELATDVDYYVVKTNYTFFNPLIKVNMTLDKIFIFSSQMEVLYSGDMESFNKLKNEYTKTPLLKYEIAMYSKMENIQF